MKTSFLKLWIASFIIAGGFMATGCNSKQQEGTHQHENSEEHGESEENHEGHDH
ncbi:MULTISPECIES: hypothetical protein [Bacteroidota]|uniref:Uncharacterized protein n=1 Tax=Thermophagus xiamenensis TaxID=385682 RepID=A0A1I1WDT7_9BACT|nr:hypothetical protein [Thermophagus xiamenensis]SFD91573.1 hypothetical protein SAMN05444380_1042 [Thermophagus xiamenensis]|tara:strand:+ start:1939 stop:2100 length:162 start_codon:yes stop_codon:yes gene_type:complete